MYDKERVFINCYNIDFLQIFYVNTLQSLTLEFRLVYLPSDLPGAGYITDRAQCKMQTWVRCSEGADKVWSEGSVVLKVLIKCGQNAR